MIVDVEMPNMGLTITEATLVRWAKQPGEAVAAGEVLFELETDKAVQEVESPVSGTILAHLAQEGDAVLLGAVVGKIGTQLGDSWHGETPSEAIAKDQAVAVSPRAKRAAQRLGVDLALVQATGRRGEHIREQDVLRAAQVHVVNAPSTTPGKLRRLTAERTAASFRDVPHFFLTRQISAERLITFRKELIADLEGHVDIRITLTDLLVKALATALSAHSALNAQWVDGGLVSLNSIDIGLAADTPEGLIVPVIRAADKLTPIEIATRRSDLVSKAREGKLAPSELSGGSFTLSNLGAGGVDQFQAIINAPQSGILAVGAVKRRPFVVGEALTACQTLFATLSLDHRVVDGVEGARFLDHLAHIIERPSLLWALPGD